MKVAYRVVSQANAGKEKRREYIGHDLVNTLRCTLAQMPRFANRDADNKCAENRVNARVFGKCRSGQRESENKAEHSTRPRGVRLQKRQQLVDQPPANGKHQTP